ncbi:MAG: formimidoylglutamate deiminase [Vulcanimicrobiaceae bacterium]
MSAFFAARARLPEGWARDVRLEVDAGGAFASVEPGGSPAGAERLDGWVLPGVPNLHSHAAQRALAGYAERAGPGEDSFWSWREAMYALVAQLDPSALETLATDLYCEMLEGGYTSVCEFHYLHRAPDGSAYADPNETSERLVAAARASGIGLVLLPALYRFSDAGGVAPNERQRRFVEEPATFAARWRRLRDRYAGDPQIAIGLAAHSLRAVLPSDLSALDALARERPELPTPLHLHAAEQRREVAACADAYGAPPIEVLAGSVALDERWCVVHATHATPPERELLARVGAVVALAPTTEANLGDGIFALREFAHLGGRFGIGSDAQLSLDPSEELRWLEYGQRLVHGARALLRDAQETSVGDYLFAGVLAAGAQASGRPIGRLAKGARADLIAITPPDEREPSLDPLIFRSGTWRVRETLVGGRRLVRDGHHPLRERLQPEVAAVVQRLTIKA